MTPNEFRDGLFALHTRRFGRVMELVVQRLCQLAPATHILHDLHDDILEHDVEVKFSRVLKSHDAAITIANVLQIIEAAVAAERMVAYAESGLVEFDCNIQQVKPEHFDILYYGLCYADTVEIFKVSDAAVTAIPGYSHFQHHGNVGEGQFHVHRANVTDHRQHRLFATLSYTELLAILQP